MSNKRSYLKLITDGCLKAIILSLIVVLGLSTELLAGPAEDDFQRRCNAPGVVACEGFDYTTPEEKSRFFDPFNDHVTEILDTNQKASGSGALRFTIRSQSGSGAGRYWRRFSKIPNLPPDDARLDDPNVQFGEGDEFYIQWRQRFSSYYIDHQYQGGHGWKQIMIDSGDFQGCNNYTAPNSEQLCAASCTQLEIVVQNGSQRKFPIMYHSCGLKDGQYHPLTIGVPKSEEGPVGGPDIYLQNAAGCRYYDFLWDDDWDRAVANDPAPMIRSLYDPPCQTYEPDQWMTFQVRVKIGTWYKNDQNYHQDSAIQLWVTKEGGPTVLTISFDPNEGTGYDLAQTVPAGQAWNGTQKYGKVWLLAFHTGKDPNEVTETAYTWYDELIISTQRIPDPTFGPPDTVAPQAPTGVQVK